MSRRRLAHASQVLDEHGNFKEANFAQLRMNAFGLVDEASGAAAAAADDEPRAGSKAAATANGSGRGGRGAVKLLLWLQSLSLTQMGCIFQPSERCAM